MNLFNFGLLRDGKLELDVDRNLFNFDLLWDGKLELDLGSLPTKVLIVSVIQLSWQDRMTYCGASKYPKQDN